MIFEGCSARFLDLCCLDSGHKWCCVFPDHGVVELSWIVTFVYSIYWLDRCCWCCWPKRLQTQGRRPFPPQKNPKNTIKRWPDVTSRPLAVEVPHEISCWRWPMSLSSCPPPLFEHLWNSGVSYVSKPSWQHFWNPFLEARDSQSDPFLLKTFGSRLRPDLHIRQDVPYMEAAFMVAIGAWKWARWVSKWKFNPSLVVLERWLVLCCFPSLEQHAPISLISLKGRFLRSKWLQVSTLKNMRQNMRKLYIYIYAIHRWVLYIVYLMLNVECRSEFSPNLNRLLTRLKVSPLATLPGCQRRAVFQVLLRAAGQIRLVFQAVQNRKIGLLKVRYCYYRYILADNNMYV